MNLVWFILITLSIIISFFTGKLALLTDAMLTSAATAVDISIGLIGIMTLWLGILKIAEKAGLVNVLSRVLRPISNILFKGVPKDHPALGYIFLNISANWLGLGNAATPFGIKAMEELDSLNTEKGTATNSMIMLLVLNTASITIIPMTIIAVRTSFNSTNPTSIISTTIFSSLCATVVGIWAVSLFSNFQEKNSGKAIFRSIFILLLLLAMIIVGYLVVRLVNISILKTAINKFSIGIIPIIIILILGMGIVKKLKIYEIFIDGAKEGFQVAIRIIPYLVGILVAIGLFRESGGMDFFVKLVEPLIQFIGMPAEVVPAALMRPFSGSGTLGIVTELMQTHGADSFIGNLASTIYGCTETTFYVIAVYFGAVHIKNTRFAIAAGLIADLAGILAAVFICRFLFL